MDNELLNEIHIVKNHSDATKKSYKLAVNKYTDFFQMSLEELLEEAETEEDEGIRWKKRKLKRRLLSFRQYLFENYNLNTVTLLFREIVFIYRYYEIEVLDLPKLNKKAALTSEPITFNDLPDKEIIRRAINIASPVMKPIIYFMASSGCARTETLNLTIKDYINSLSDYSNKTDIYEVISEIDGQTNVVPTFKILRQKN